jgi:hypothetical protein
MYKKKSQIPIQKTLIILGFSTIIFITMLLLLFQTTKINIIDDKKLKTQVVISKIFNSNCLSKEYGTIEEKYFNEDNLNNNCFKNLENKINMKLTTNDGRDEIYINQKSEFETKKDFCSAQDSNILCTRMVYPVTYIDNLNKEKTTHLIVEIISA